MIVRRWLACKFFNLKKETLEFLGSLCSHAIEKSPLQSLFARCLKFLTPNFIVESSRSWNLMFENIHENLVSCKQLPSREADAAKLEFSNFLSTTVKENKDSFVKFDKENDRSYTFIWQFFLDTNKFITLGKVLKMLMILSHGQRGKGI